MTDRPPADDDDFLDGMCGPGFDSGPPVPDEWTPWVVLFADLLTPDLKVRDHRALARRAGEWRHLFETSL